MLTTLDKSKSVLLVDDRLFCQEVYLYQLLSGVVIVVFGCGIPLIFGVDNGQGMQTYSHHNQNVHGRTPARSFCALVQRANSNCASA